MKIIIIALLSIASLEVSAQKNTMQFFRPYDERGLHMFETTKADTIPFKKLRVQVGGSFEQTFQTLRDVNTAEPLFLPQYKGNVNSLIPLSNGFNLAMANLSIDAQLSDGIRVNLTVYLSSRHHEDTWVKGGYIQFDKLLFLHNDVVDNIMKSVTIKIGQFDVDYGDQHFRRTDGGSTLYNPFVENYIMDEFATEIGAEFFYHHKSGLFVMGGISNGELDPTVVAPTKMDTLTGQVNKYDPAFHGKIGFDKQFNQDFRFRLTGSFYSDVSANSNTLFGGDRTGSHYFYVMENQNVANGTSISDEVDYSPFSGRFNPGFTEQVSTVMINPFIKYKGLELFATYENAHGRSITETTKRQAIQYAADLIYRFPAEKENFWIGVRYNTVTSAVQGLTQDITINREVASAGWFLTRNIMLKVEYVNQVYQNYPVNNILNGGKFYGTMFEAAIAF
ncbi:MAG TPA: hypothetical protein VK711_10655 [Puia sp.]|nr:hypothetical protein [Puia sp.]